MSTPRAFVVTPETMYSSGGGQWPTPAGIITDLPYLLSRSAAMFHLSGVLVLMGVKLDALNLEGLAKEWLWTKVEAWTTFRPKDHSRAAVHVCVVDEVVPRRGDLFTRDTAPELIAQRLGRVHEAVGLSYRMTAGVTGSAIMRAIHTDRREGRQPMWVDRQGTPGRMAGPIHWSRDVDLVELCRPGMRAVKLDVRACYPTAAGVAPLAWSTLTHTPDAVYERGLAGYWLIRPPVVNGGGPQPCDQSKAVRKDGRRIGVWVTTPVMELYSDLGVHPDPIDAWTAPAVQCAGPPLPSSPRLLRTWSERLTEARNRVSAEWLADMDGDWEIIAATLKHIGNDAIGMLARPGGRAYRVDWQHTIIDQARANLLRKVYARHKLDGVWPLRVSGVDSMWYATDHPDLTGMEPWIGDGPGKIRPVDELPMDVYAERAAKAAGKTTAAAA